jgi:hypothetical protein
MKGKPTSGSWLLIDEDARAYLKRVARKDLWVVSLVKASAVQESGVDTSVVIRKPARRSLQSIPRPAEVRQLPTRWSSRWDHHWTKGLLRHRPESDDELRDQDADYDREAFLVVRSQTAQHQNRHSAGSITAS